MRCPNRKCGRPTDRIVVKFGANGKRSFQGCPRCAKGEKFMHVYSGRKLWTGVEVYGAEKCSEMDLAYEQKILSERARRPTFRRIA